MNVTFATTIASSPTGEVFKYALAPFGTAIVLGLAMLYCFRHGRRKFVIKKSCSLSPSSSVPCSTPTLPVPPMEAIGATKFVNLFQAGVTFGSIEPTDKLKRFVSFKLAGRIILTVAFGDLTSFDSYPHGAIVNAANEECKTGGGVSKSLHDEGVQRTTS